MPQEIRMNPAQLYSDLGATPVINAAGYQTVLGGSRLSPAVQEAMAAANRHYVEMAKLLLSTGEEIAGLLGSEAAMVTPGCGAALALSSAACMSAGNPARMEQLPDTTGIPNEFLLQARQHYHYQRCLTIFGGVLVDAGDEAGTSAAQLQAVIGDNTAAIHYFASGDEDNSILDLEGVFSVAAPRELPVTVDAAYQVYPLVTMRNLASSGGLVGFGAKYIGAPNSTGILCGPRDLLEAAYLHSFIGFETSDYETLGRPLKLDRQEVVAVVVALREWLSMDHKVRIAEHWVRADRIIDNLRRPSRCRSGAPRRGEQSEQRRHGNSGREGPGEDGRRGCRRAERGGTEHLDAPVRRAHPGGRGAPDRRRGRHRHRTAPTPSERMRSALDKAGSRCAESSFRNRRNFPLVNGYSHT